MRPLSSVGSNGKLMADAAVTIIELLVSMAVFVILIGVLLTMISQTGSIALRTSNKLGAYESSRFAFELVTRTVSQATLNAYYDYVDSSGNFIAPAYTATPTSFARRSALDFVITGPQTPTLGGSPVAAFNQGNSIFFQAKLGQSTTFPGMDGLLNDVGFYVTYCKNPNLPLLLQPYDKYRFRLMEYLQPSENLTSYSLDANGSLQWFTTDLGANSFAIADNVILVLFWPQVSQQAMLRTGYVPLTTNYLYNSGVNVQTTPQPATANQEPPLVQVTLVAIDESTANRLCVSSTPPAAVTGCLTGLFQSTVNYATDLQQLEANLTSNRIGFRIFNSMVPLRESKWIK